MFQFLSLATHLNYVLATIGIKYMSVSVNTSYIFSYIEEMTILEMVGYRNVVRDAGMIKRGGYFVRGPIAGLSCT